MHIKIEGIMKFSDKFKERLEDLSVSFGIFKQKLGFENPDVKKYSPQNNSPQNNSSDKTPSKNANNIKKSFVRRVAAGEMPVASAIMNITRGKSTGRGER